MPRFIALAYRRRRHAERAAFAPPAPRGATVAFGKALHVCGSDAAAPAACSAACLAVASLLLGAMTLAMLRYRRTLDWLMLKFPALKSGVTDEY